MTRGEIWTVAASGEYSGKPRPAVIIQATAFADLAAVTICGFTTTEVERFPRIEVEPSSENGLTERSWLMVDKVTTVPRGRLGRRVGQLGAADLERLDRGLLVFLGLTETRR